MQSDIDAITAEAPVETEAGGHFIAIIKGDLMAVVPISRHIPYLFNYTQCGWGWGWGRAESGLPFSDEGRVFQTSDELNLNTRDSILTQSCMGDASFIILLPLVSI